MLPQPNSRVSRYINKKANLGFWLAGSLIIIAAYTSVFRAGLYGYNDDYMLLYRGSAR